VRLLLDTHAFLWFVLDDPRLSSEAKSAIENPDNEIEFSPASYWEIAIKIALRNYTLWEPYGPFMEQQVAINQFRILPIELRHTALLTTMPTTTRIPSIACLWPNRFPKRFPSSATTRASTPTELCAFGKSAY